MNLFWWMLDPISGDSQTKVAGKNFRQNADKNPWVQSQIFLRLALGPRQKMLSNLPE
jgi:hypothetical protein